MVNMYGTFASLTKLTSSAFEAAPPRPASFLGKDKIYIGALTLLCLA